MATLEAMASITTDRKRSAPLEAEDTACQAAHKKRFLPAGEYCPIPRAAQEYLRDPEQAFALFRSQTSQLLSKASEQKEAQKKHIQRQEAALDECRSANQTMCGENATLRHKIQKYEEALKASQSTSATRDQALRQQQQDIDSLSHKNAELQNMLNANSRQQKGLEEQVNHERGRFTQLQQALSVQLAHISPRIRLDPLKKVGLLRKELMQQQWKNRCLSREPKQANAPQPAPCVAQEHNSQAMDCIPTPPETPSPQSSGSAVPASLNHRSHDAASPSEPHSFPSQEDLHSSTARPGEHEVKESRSQSGLSGARDDGNKDMEASGSRADANTVHHRTIAKRQRRQQNAPGTIQRVRSGLLASKHSGRSILGSRRVKAIRASQIDQALRKEDEDNLLHFANAHDSQSMSKDEVAQMSSSQSVKALEIAVSAGIFDDTIKNLQLVAARDNFRQGEYHKLKLNQFYKNAAQNEMALYIRRESGAIIECHGHPLQLRPENTSIHILPWPKVSNKTTEEVASMLGTWSLFAQLPELQAEAAAFFLSSDDLTRFKERSFGDPNYSTENFGLKRRLAEYWDRAVKALRRHEPFKTACRMWVAGCDSTNKVRCWPPTFKNIQDFKNSLQQSSDAADPNHDNSRMNTTPTAKDEWNMDDMLNTLIEASKQKSQAQDPQEDGSELEDADSQSSSFPNGSIVRSGEDSDEEL